MIGARSAWARAILRRGAGDRRRSRRGLYACASALATAALLATFAPTAGAFEDLSGGAYQILAPGDSGSLSPNENAIDQGELYNALTPLGGSVTQSDIESLYASEKFGVTGPVKETENPEAGLEIKRDHFGIPHVFGETRPEVMFGSGWIASKDRGILLALGLGPAFAAAIEPPGLNPFELLLTGRQFTPSAQGYKYVAEQEKVLIEKGPRGEQVLQDLENWAAGVNAQQESLGAGRFLPPINAVNAIAGFAFIGSIFGNGGGNEVADSELLSRLEAKLGVKKGLGVFHDLREINDPEAPTTATTEFPYDGVPTGPTPGGVLVDPGSASAAAVHAASTLESSRRKMSNFLVVGGEKTASGHPLAVMGPQLGYFYPEIVMQGDLHGPGIDASGIIAPISPYVFIGRGRDFAWSLTSAGSENVQTFAEKLCNPEPGGTVTRETRDYMYKGSCIEMTKFDAGKLAKGNGEPEHEVEFFETVHGPIVGTVTVGGQPYAIARDRATRGHEPAGELAFSDLDSDVVHSPSDFFKAANELETTFNMSYLDNKHIAYFSTGRLPVLAPGTDPSLPTLGTGEYDWQGFLTESQHPHEVDPASDLFLNWNNKPAPGWGAASDTFSYGPVHRVQMYNGFKSGMTEADDVSIMNRAATQDLRAIKVWPVIEKVLAAEPAPNTRASEAAGLVTKWVEEGAARLGTEHAENPGAAVMDAAWAPIATAVMHPVLGKLTSELASVASIDNPPNPRGSSFGEGWYGYVYKDLRSLLGEPVAQPYSRHYCGAGKLTVCAKALWSAISSAAGKLAAKQGPNPSAWRAANVRIEFPPASPFTMEWTNRSTFQQVIEFTGHVEELGCSAVRHAAC